jgi:hypothetical protein
LAGGLDILETRTWSALYHIRTNQNEVNKGVYGYIVDSVLGYSHITPVYLQRIHNKLERAKRKKKSTNN